MWAEGKAVSSQAEEEMAQPQWMLTCEVNKGTGRLYLSTVAWRNCGLRWDA